MKLIFSFALLSLIAVGINAQSVGIATTAIVPDASSMLEIQSINKGLLIPRVALTATNVAGPIVSPATSLMVYNTATAGAGATAVAPGYYYNAGTPAAPNWTRLLGGKDAWLTTGNFGTVPANNWLGTNDAQDFATRTNNVERTRILSAGNILFNRTTALYATDLFEAQGNATFPDAISGYTNQAAGTGVYGENNTATGAGAGAGVYGISLQTGSAGTVGDGATATRGVLGITTNATYAGVQGQNNDAGGDGVYGINAAATGAGGGAGVYGYSTQTGAAGVIGDGNTTTRGVIGITNNASYVGVHAQNANAGGDALYAVNSAGAGAGVGSAIYANSNQTGGATIIACLQSTSYYSNAGVSVVNDVASGNPIGVIGDVFRNTGTGIYGINTAASGTGTGNGVFGSITQSAGFGVNANNDHASGTGLIASGNNTTGSYMTTGSGGAFTGTGIGSYSLATAAVSTGVIGVGNNQTANTIAAQGSGGAFTGDDFGVYGLAVNSGNDTWGGYFDHGGTSYAYVGGRTGGTNYKILGSGSVSTIIPNPQGGESIMYAPEAPEILFQDYGTGNLVNGKAHIVLDPILTNNIFVDEQHPMKVFIQLEGDCYGVYVTNKTSQGFDVIELQNGTSNASFSWTIVANRADSKDENGVVVSKHVDVRFPDAPDRLERTTQESSEATPVENPRASTIDETTTTPAIDDSNKVINNVKQQNPKE